MMEGKSTIQLNMPEAKKISKWVKLLETKTPFLEMSRNIHVPSSLWNHSKNPLKAVLSAFDSFYTVPLVTCLFLISFGGILFQYSLFCGDKECVEG